MNIAATTVENYRKLKDAGIGTYILFQETYHKKSYLELHPTGPKHDYDYHTEAMDRAMDGGIDDVGLGVLFGLGGLSSTSSPACSCTPSTWKPSTAWDPHTISVPRVKHADDIDPDVFDNGIARRHCSQKIIACIRIAVPYTGMIISTRESEAVPRKGAPPGHFADQRRVPAPRWAATPKKSRPHDSEQFDVSDQRSLDEVVRLAHGDGLHPLLLHRLLPRGPYRRPVHEPVQERSDLRTAATPTP